VATKILTAIDLAKNELRNGVIQNLASAPSSPVKGQVYFDTTLNQFGCYNGTSWVYEGGASGNVSQSGNSASSGIMKVSAGANTNIADYAGGSGIVKSNGSGVVSAAVASTDYAPATSGSSILKGNGSGGFSAAVSNTDYAPVASPTFTGAVTVPAPSNSTDAATKAYVDAVSQGLAVKASARAATTGSETFTVSSGNVTQIAGTTVDGVSPAVGDRILVKDAPASTGAGSASSSQPGNGVYTVTSATTNLSLSRAADLSGSNAPAGAFVFVEAGTANAAAGYVVSTPSSAAAFTYGTGSIAWTQFSGAGEITAGTGLSKAGNTLSLTSPVAVANGGTNATSVAGAKTSLGFASIYTSGTIGDGSSTTLTVTHSLGTNTPLVQVWDVSGANPVRVICDVTATSTNAVQLAFGTAPATNSLKCVVLG
jgi:hypothetical protein